MYNPNSMEKMDKIDLKMGYEIPMMSIIKLIIEDRILQGSLDVEELEDTEPLDGSWRN